MKDLKMEKIWGNFCKAIREGPSLQASDDGAFMGFFFVATMRTRRTFVFALEPMESCRGRDAVKNTAEYPAHIFSSSTIRLSPPFYSLSSVNPQCVLTKMRWMGIVFNVKKFCSRKPWCDNLSRVIPAAMRLFCEYRK